MSGIRFEEQENSYEIHVVRDWLNKYGFPGTRARSFLMSIFEGFANADGSNFELMRPFIREIIKKYSLQMRCTCIDKWEARLPDWLSE